MRKEYAVDKTVLLSDCDYSGRLSITGILDIFMDIATLHEDELGFSAMYMKERGLYWIIGKNRIHILRRPEMMERTSVRSWPLKPSRLYGNREYLLETESGEPLIYGETEWLVASEGLEKLMDVRQYHPKDMIFETRELFDSKMKRVSKEFAPGQKLGTYTVRPTDIDFVGHMNNAAYSRAILSFIPIRELKGKEIEDVEIFYGLQCMEGDELSICKRDAEDGNEYGAFLPDGRNVVTARITFKES